MATGPKTKQLQDLRDKTRNEHEILSWAHEQGESAPNGVPAIVGQSVNLGGIHESYEPNQGQRFGNAQELSAVDTSNPNTIHVYQPDAYTPSVRGHELTHVLQDTRQDGVTMGQNVPYGENGHADAGSYGYGGPEALLTARAAGKTMGHYNLEQQAQMVQDYIHQSRAIEAKAEAGKATKKDLQQYALLQRAYHPFIHDLAPQPIGGINTNLGVPGAPSPTIAGAPLTPDPDLGGQMVMPR